MANGAKMYLNIDEDEIPIGEVINGKMIYIGE